MKPLVSILIPTYNRVRFFTQALFSALNQTYENIEIIICDNSEGNETEKIMEILAPHFTPPVSYHKNAVNIGPIKNFHKCLELAKGEFINFLMDDDLFHPQKIEKMMHYFINHKGTSLVTSYRLTIDKNGCLLKPIKATKKLFNKDTMLGGEELAAIMLKKSINFIGEPTTVLFKKNCLDEPFGDYGGYPANFNHDVASWLNILEKGKAVYMAEALSYFRLHDTQLQKNPAVKDAAIRDWKQHLKLWQDKHHKP